MQYRFDFLAGDLRRWVGLLRPLLNGIELLPRLSPEWMLVKAMISGRTRDAVSQATFDRLRGAYRSVEAIAAAPPIRIERTIHTVTYAKTKARHLTAALDRIRENLGTCRLDFLTELPLDDARIFLEALPGVGTKIAATTLNASTLDFPVMIVDTPVLRILRRLRIIGTDTGYGAASAAVTGALPDMSGRAFFEFHVAMKRLGQNICTYRDPQCGRCPLATECPGVGGNGTSFLDDGH